MFHTLGKWVTGETINQKAKKAKFNPYRVYVIDEKDGQPYCVADCDLSPASSANANLIAAAPEMQGAIPCYLH